jgi:5'-nucleotidase
VTGGGAVGTRVAMPRILVTNDDGVQAEGLRTLVAALVGREAGDPPWEVAVVAPAHDVSGASASLGALDEHGRVPVEQVTVEGLTVPTWALHGPPGLAVLAARLGAFGPPPDVIVSGINRGPNTGRSILHSGTVGAVLTAQNFGAAGLAVSLDGVGTAAGFARAAALAVQALELLGRCAPGTVLNVNVPDTDRELRGWRWASLAPFGAVRTAVAGEGALQLEFRSEPDADVDPDTDAALVHAGYATVTALTGVMAADPGTIPEQLAAHDVTMTHVPVAVGGTA